MLTNLIFLLVISSGSVWCSVKFRKRFEEILPLTCMTIVMILFVFGVAGIMEMGVLVVFLTALLMYVLAVFELWKDRAQINNSIRESLQLLITPGTLIFLSVYVLFAFFLEGKLACNWDEFSHWIDIVKVMTTLDDFGTNPLAHSSFQSYPPAMTLFQYFLQKIYLFVNPNNSFCEWRTYFAYQMLFFSIPFPLITGLNFRNQLSTIVFCIIIFFLPVLFYSDVYAMAYIDPFLSVLLATGLAMIFAWEKKDALYTVYIGLICGTLVLAKDVGLVLAIFVALIYVGDLFIRTLSEARMTPHTVCRKTVWLQVITIIASVMVPHYLWKWKLVVTNATIAFETHIDGRIIADVLLGRDDGYRTQVFENYKNALFETGIFLGYTGSFLSYIGLIISAIFIGGCLCRYLNNIRIISKAQAMWFWVMLSILIIFYVIGMCIIYMFNFSSYEAVRLASMDRYLNIVFLGVFWAEALSFERVLTITGVNRQKYYEIGFLCLILLIVPLKNIKNFVSRKNVDDSIAVRAEYEMLSEKIQSVCDGDDKIWLISQATHGLNMYIIKFNARPNYVNDEWAAWSIGQPFYDGDVWSMTISSEEWKKRLEDYDYVAIYRLNDYFYEHFGNNFADRNSIAENEMYRVNKDDGLLYIVE